MQIKSIKQGFIILTLCVSLTIVLTLYPTVRKTNNKENYVDYVTINPRHVSKKRDSSNTLNNSYHKDKKNAICTPQNYIGYLKVHKTGSTTIMMIFLRYGIYNNLTFVLPPKGVVNLGSPVSLELLTLPKLNGKHFNILTHHTRFNQTGFRDVLGPNTIFIGSLRDPVKVFTSTFNHFKLDTHRHLPSIHIFLQDPEKYENITKRFSFPFTKNFQSFHYGFDSYTDVSQEELRQKTQEIESQFSLIIISEYFQESLILLKRLLCWQLKDVAYIDLNVKNYTSKNDKFSHTEMNNFNKLHIIDQYLYNHFNKTLWWKISQQGPDFQDELEVFNAFSGVISNYCKSTVKQDNITFHDEFNKVDIVVKAADCDVMTAKAQDVTRALKMKQYPNLPKKEDYKKSQL